MTGQISERTWLRRLADRALRFTIGRWFWVQRRFARQSAVRFTSRVTPELVRAYSAFVEVNQISARRQPFKGYDLWRLLEHSRPTNVVELGSGTTSAVLLAWADRNGVQYTIYEDNPRWAIVTEDCLRKASVARQALLDMRVVPPRVGSDGNAVGFTQAIPLDVDFVYVDGPPCRLSDGRKVPNDDVTRLFETGGRPRVIVIDGRLETVDLIRRHPVSEQYSFSPSFAYAYQNRLWRCALRCNEHSVFRLR